MTDAAWKADLPALFNRIEERGLHLAAVRGVLGRLAAELVPDLRKRINEGERLIEEYYERDEPGWLTSQLATKSRETRAAVYVRTTELDRATLREEDPVLRRIAAGALVHSATSDQWTAVALVDPDPGIRTLLALNFLGTDEHVWSTLATDADERVRAAMLWNEHAPASPRPAVDDPSALVRASHPDASEGELRELASDASDEVLAAVARHRHTPPDALLTVSQRFKIKPRRTGLGEVTTRTALDHVRWSFDRKHHGSVAAFVTAVTAHNVALAPDWQWPSASEVAIADPVIKLVYLGKSGKAGTGSLLLRASDPARGFTEADLLWQLHEALTGVRLGDHRLFERLHELAPDEVGDAEHPVWHLTLGA